MLFFGLLIIMPVITLLSPDKEFSENENRVLASMPKFSVDSIMERKYMNGIENYLSDHFIGRVNWISLKTDLELSAGKKEINGVFILKDRLIEKFEEPDSIVVEKSIKAINDFADKTQKNVYVMIAPTSAGIYSSQIPANAPIYNQKVFIDHVYESLENDNITTLDVYSPLFASRNEYIYYRTDHHWTSLGAYYAYYSTIKMMGFSPIYLSSFDIQHASSDFMGTLYSKVLYDKITPDTIDFYYYNKGVKINSVEVDTGVEIKAYNSIYFNEFLDKKDKYSSFLGTNQQIVTIKTDSPTNKKLLLFKDSYAHCYIQFLAQHYSEIKMVDMRYINGSIEDYVDVEGYDQIMFLYNASNFATDENLKKLSY